MTTGNLMDRDTLTEETKRKGLWRKVEFTWEMGTVRGVSGDGNMKANDSS